MLDLISKNKLALVLVLSMSACVSAPGTHEEVSDQAPIENPFGNFARNTNPDRSNITLTTRRGDQAVEVTLPQDQNSDLSVPMNPKFAGRHQEAAVGETAENGVDYQYQKQKPTTADREIASTFNNADDSVNDAKKREIEQSLGLQPSDEPLAMDESYLAKMDIVKQLFNGGRFEAALIEIDQLIKLYPTNGRIYEMRGTLLDRLGYPDLALKSWKQALEFEPRKLSLKKIIDKREAQRSVASQKQ